MGRKILAAVVAAASVAVLVYLFYNSQRVSAVGETGGAAWVKAEEARSLGGQNAASIAGLIPVVGDTAALAAQNMADVDSLRQDFNHSLEVLPSQVGRLADAIGVVQPEIEEHGRRLDALEQKCFGDGCGERPVQLTAAPPSQCLPGYRLRCRPTADGCQSDCVKVTQVARRPRQKTQLIARPMPLPRPEYIPSAGRQTIVVYKTVNVEAEDANVTVMGGGDAPETAAAERKVDWNLYLHKGKSQ
ncbi:MAG TPA: hypothetical protein VMX18_01655 [Candidatus Bipolaricaulota bacterium]|nr:hypothetical protein [Candidatus Bipolaricaulota bacterium]